jgi:glyoxylase-like metal-dependent hydrolase (beta-lactamase superfamily II)
MSQSAPRRSALLIAALLAATLAGAQSRRSATPPAPAAAETVRLLPVRPNVYMLSAGGTNVAVHVGKHGVLLVDTPPPALVPQALAAIAQITPAPIRYVINTSAARDHIGGNEAIVTQARAPGGPRANLNPVLLGSAEGMTILAHEAVLNGLIRLTGANAVPRGMLPTNEYFEATKDFSFNSEPIIVYHMPAAHSNGDSLVLLRSADVIVTGDLFTPDRYPHIDRANGGSVQGLLAALNTILAMTVPEAFAEGGTKVIPGHGRLSEEIDVVEYRDMVYLVTERVRDLAAKGKTLAEIQAARPTLDYDLEYPSPAVTPAMFVEAIYSSLVDEAGE